jgi:DNA-damage-inducible protein J
MKTAVIRARIDAKLKADAVAVLSACGLEVSDAIRLFLMQVVAQRGLPFTISADPAPQARISFAVHDRPDDPFLIRRDELIGVTLTWPDARLDD